ncbi:hypothetical protein KUV61_14860 [Nocardioides marinus]|nr:hypothetical protein [Nocardioides marinus]
MFNPSRQAREMFSRISGLLSATAPGGQLRSASKARAVPVAVPVPVPTTQPKSVEQTAASPAPRLEDSLSIPICEADGDPEAVAAQDQGQFLARQELWAELSAEIRAADQARTVTSSGLPIAELIAFGARADVVHATEHALAEGKDAGSRALIRGLMAFEALRAEHRRDPYLTALVALAHIDIGWAWRRPDTAQAVTPPNQRRCAAHFNRAAALLHPIAELSADSPFLRAAQCALLAGQGHAPEDVADEFGALIALLPRNHRPMRSLGTLMLPRSAGSYAALELEARRTAANTAETWGAGGYTWVYFDALALDDQACARVDTRVFLAGLRDIVAAAPSQEMINLLTAYCCVTLHRAEDTQLEASHQAAANRRQIASAADWLIRDHLQELHPMVWAHAAEGFDNSARVRSVSRFAARGEADGLAAIAGHFREEISAGQTVTFTAEGPRFTPA